MSTKELYVKADHNATPKLVQGQTPFFVNFLIIYENRYALGNK